ESFKGAGALCTLVAWRTPLPTGDRSMPITTLLRSFFFTALIAAVPAACAADEIRAQEFDDQASAAGVAEIASARMALQKSQEAEVHNFAEQMIKDHTKANEDLKELAMNKQLEVASEADLMNKA